MEEESVNIENSVKISEKIDKLPFLGVYYEKNLNICIYFIKFNWMY